LRDTSSLTARFAVRKKSRDAVPAGVSVQSTSAEVADLKVREMRILRVGSENQDIVGEVVNELEKGNIIIYPTDTVYGIGCSIFSRNVAKIFEIKKREKDKPLSVAFSDLKMAKTYAEIDNEQERFIAERMDGPYTFIVKKKSVVPNLITACLGTVGIRIINHPLTREIIKNFGKPIVTTSANVSGKPAPADINEIEKSVLDSVSLVLDAGRCKHGVPSKIIDLTKGRKILRDYGFR